MHTNISEANMMVLRSQKAQGILVGFEFAILEDCSSQNKQMRSSHNHVSPVRTTDTGDSHGTMSIVSGLASGDATTHHVASLPLSRCSDRPPVHQFRHELESFVWSIFFILCGFRRGRRIDNADLELWYTGSWKSIMEKKYTFLKDGTAPSEFAGKFAESLGVNPQPMQACSEALGDQLSRPGTLDAARLLATLQEARDAYAGECLPG